MTFDSVAPFYDLLAQLMFGRALIRAQQWGIEQVRLGGRVLLLGGGTGITLPSLLAQQPGHILYVEASAAMMAKARQRTQPGAPVTFLIGTEAGIAEQEQFDCILLPFVLDIYPAETLQVQMLPKLLSHLKPNGQLIVTDFARPNACWQRAYMWLMLRFFTFTAGIPVQKWTNWPDALLTAGLVETRKQVFRGGQVRSGCWVRN
ncbi:class I SAM-dependent methyltransferase [Fibrella forsythiae]|uniref:Class I SAM-dependent methyltransferase n=1 Tax=Fibrella forsythiae TaxID=2817061 RepID=A0ABS3JCL5_9BACT|nr:class I SAM-dependent methyltransferase [Fibrella forsythiae]MBO0947730.1 class I SAM-dependent methyltransferase [Fibrella forsythiae]